EEVEVAGRVVRQLPGHVEVARADVRQLARPDLEQAQVAVEAEVRRDQDAKEERGPEHRREPEGRLETPEESAASVLRAESGRGRHTRRPGSAERLYLSRGDEGADLRCRRVEGLDLVVAAGGAEAEARRVGRV